MSSQVIQVSDRIQVSSGQTYVLPSSACTFYANGSLVSYDCTAGLSIDGFLTSRLGDLDLSVRHEYGRFLMEVEGCPITRPPVIQQTVCTIGGIDAGHLIAGQEDQVFSQCGREIARITRSCGSASGSEEIFTRSGDLLCSQVVADNDSVCFKTRTNALTFVDGGVFLLHGDIYMGSKFRLHKSARGIVIERLEESSGEYIERLKLETA
jgi:hypothetical protein